MSVSDQTLLQLREIQFRWRPSDADILNIDEFTVMPGERVFIQGSSGSGKTTLLSLIGGVVTPQNGSMHILNTDLTTLRRSQRDRFRANHIGFIFQMFNLIPYLSLVENVTLPCRFSVKRRNKVLQHANTLEEEAKRLLNHLELDTPTLAKRPVVELSVGQQQRVAAARALIGSPELLIADEPTSALDSDVRQIFLNLLMQEVAASNTTVLFVSHDASLRTYFDRTITLTSINRASQQIN